MRQLITPWALGIFSVVYLLVAGTTYWRAGVPNFSLAGVIAGLAALFITVRFYFILKPEMARREAERREAECREHEGDLFNQACREVADAMSDLSEADFSVFVTCHHMLAQGEDGYRFLTARGSPVHDVLVRMTDVRCARPHEMKPIYPGCEASTANYELTRLGKAMLPHFLQDAANVRRARRGFPTGA